MNQSTGCIVDKQVQHVESGLTITWESERTVSELIDAPTRTNALVNEIAGASVEQAAGIEMVRRAVIQLNEITQQNAALVEGVSAAAVNMEDHTWVLEQSVSVFVLDGPGNSVSVAVRRMIEGALPDPSR